MAKSQDIPFSQELLRKGIHLISLSIPVCYVFVTKQFALTILIPITLAFLIMDLLSKGKKNPAKDFVHRYFGKMLRFHELSDKFVLNGATWVLLSACLTVLVFPKIIAVTAFSILIISDISAAIFGRWLGKHPLFTKSWEGTIAFMISAIIVVSIIGYFFKTPWSFFVFGYAAAIIAAFVEAASSVIKVDDNFAIPISAGIVMWVGGYLSVSINAPFLFIL